MRKENTPGSVGALGFRSPYVVFDGSICVTSTALAPHVIISTTALSTAYFTLGMLSPVSRVRSAMSFREDLDITLRPYLAHAAKAVK
jgi:hypothetical protein